MKLVVGDEYCLCYYLSLDGMERSGGEDMDSIVVLEEDEDGAYRRGEDGLGFNSVIIQHLKLMSK